MQLSGRPIDLGGVSAPCYFLSTVEDHIAPWRASYPATQVIAGPVEFVLAGSGHIAGIVNPPSRRKYGYRISQRRPVSPDEWLAGAEQQQSGSWWPHWSNWLETKDRARPVPARRPGDRRLAVIEGAPGSYVLGK